VVLVALQRGSLLRESARAVDILPRCASRLVLSERKPSGVVFPLHVARAAKDRETPMHAKGVRRTNKGRVIGPGCSDWFAWTTSYRRIPHAEWTINKIAHVQLRRVDLPSFLRAVLIS